MSPRKANVGRPVVNDLRDACIEAAREAIAAHGVEQLSLRDVARRLGVSHQAPYRHYPSRDHLLAEVVRRCFNQFARHLDARVRSDDPKQELAALGMQYLSFAALHPLEYRLMFGTPWPQAADHPDLIRDATHAFDILRGVLRRVSGEQAGRDVIDLDALYIWSTMHGLAGVLNGNCIAQLELSDHVREHASAHVMNMIECAMVGRSLQHGPRPDNDSR